MQNPHTPERRRRGATAIPALPLLIALAVVGAPAALAGNPPSQGEGATLLHGGDRDGDGRLSRTEYDEMSRNHGASTPPAGEGVPATEHQANVLKKFEDRDRDGDGFITAEEFDLQDAN